LHANGSRAGDEPRAGGDLTRQRVPGREQNIGASRAAKRPDFALHEMYDYLEAEVRGGLQIDPVEIHVLLASIY
jgi:hypothetical protein